MVLEATFENNFFVELAQKNCKVMIFRNIKHYRKKMLTQAKVEQWTDLFGHHLFGYLKS